MKSVSFLFLIVVHLTIVSAPAADKPVTLAECGTWMTELDLLTRAREKRVAVDVTFAPKAARNPSAPTTPQTQTLFVGPITTEGEVSVVFRDGYMGRRTEVMCRSCIIAGSVKLREDVPDILAVIGDAASQIKEPGQLIELTFQESGKTQTIRAHVLDVGREADVKFREKVDLSTVREGEIPVDRDNTDPDPRMVVKVALLDGKTRLIDLYDIQAGSVKVVVDEALALQAKRTQAVNMLWSAIVASVEVIDEAKPTVGRVHFKNGETAVMDGPMSMGRDFETDSMLIVYKDDKGKKVFTRVFPAPLTADLKGFTETPQHITFYEGDDVVMKQPELAGLGDDWLLGPFVEHGMYLGTVGANGELVWGENMNQMGWFKNMVGATQLMPQLTRSFTYFRAGTSRAIGTPGFTPPPVRR